MPLDIGLSGVVSGPGTWNATGMFVLMAIAFLGGTWFVRSFTRLRECDVYTCGLPPDKRSEPNEPLQHLRQHSRPSGRQGEPLMDTLLAIPEHVHFSAGPLPC